MLQTGIQKRELTEQDKQAIGRLLVDILSGEIDKETRRAINDLGDPREIPQPYTDLVAFTDGFVGDDNRKLADFLIRELHVIMMELAQKHPAP
ncbi:MAG TPA: hypothetical protein VJM08_11780 [Anaerolineales bacterium]|nr:hypothetical protein [Anaerolineales bacterium]